VWDKPLYLFNLMKRLFKKYQGDHAYIIVSSISFYVLLTFIPFTLFSISILGHVIDLSNAVGHLEGFMRNIVPEPYNTIIIRKVIKEANLLTVTKRLSGPLGLIFLILFTMRLFATLRPAFRIIFRTEPKSFIHGKGEDFMLTVIFSVIQTVLFFSFVFSFLIQTRLTSILPGFIAEARFLYAYSGVDIVFTFIMFYLLYYFLSPLKRRRGILVVTSLIATLFWYLGKFGFQYYVLHLTRITAFLGAYGAFVAVLFWVYFSVFVFITCAELQSVLLLGLTSPPAAAWLPEAPHSRVRRR
jgi:membrane protein